MSEQCAERLDRLESHIAHLEHQVEQLNEVAIEQGKTIERLRRQVQLQSRTQETLEVERAKANNPKPPHY